MEKIEGLMMVLDPLDFLCLGSSSARIVSLHVELVASVGR